MTRAPAPVPSPIERFLGPEARRGGPFGLLRITPETCTDERIVASLEWQLDRVAQHPEGDTPEADEVRLALHAAAAQLLDPSVRRHVLASVRGKDVAPGGGPATTQAGAQGTVKLTGLEQDAIRTLAQYGGWNKQSLERLKALAYARGMGSRELAQTLQNLATRKKKSGSGNPRGGEPPRGARSGETSGMARGGDAQARGGDVSFVDPGMRYVRNLVLGIVGVVLGLLAIVVVAALLLTSGPSVTPPKPEAREGADAAGPVKSPDMSTPGKNDTAAKGSGEGAKEPAAAFPLKTAKPAPTDPVANDPKAMVRALAECAQLARRDADPAADRFVALVEILAARWAKFDEASRRAADASVVDMVFATASYPEASERVLGAISAGAERMAQPGALGAEETWPAVWSVGILTRLSRERDLSHGVAGTIDRALTAAIGADRPRTEASFETGALAALRRVPERLVLAPAGEVADGAVGIKSWIEAMAAVVGTDGEQRERVLVDALGRLLVNSAEPTENRRVYDAVQALVTEIRWRRGGLARLRLLDWFRDNRVSAGDMQVVTAVLASRSSAEGVDAMMVLSVGASPSERQRLRTAYAKAWGIAESVGEDKESADWLIAIKNELERTTDGVQPADLLVMATTLAGLNEAATRLWRGEAEVVVTLVEDAVDLPNTITMKVTRPAARNVTRGPEGDGQWMASYQSLGRNTTLRGEKLIQIEKYTTSVGPVDGEFLFYLACFESPAELRASAQRAVLNLSSEPAIVNAALELLPRAPRYASVGTLYEAVARKRLPRPTEAGWELETRRALVSRLLELMAASGDDAKIDELASLLGTSYSVRAGLVVAADAPRDGGAERAADAAAALTGVWRSHAEAVAPNEYAPIPLDLIDRRKLGRLRLAEGPVQRFAAEQVTTAELMAYVVSAEHPRLAKQAREIVDEMSRSRRRATHIFEQVMHTERAMLLLWRLRIAGDQK